MERLAGENPIKNLFATLTFLTAISLSISLYADRTDFCAGFEEGYKTIKGDLIIIPICPVAPITPIGSTDFREGIKAGISAAGE